MSDDQADAMGAIWEEAKAETAQQNSDIDSLRNRAAALLSVEALVGGLFGSRLPSGHMRALNTGGLVTALVLFSVSVALVVAIAWPRSWRGGLAAFLAEADDVPLAERVATGTAALAEVNYALASRAEQNWTANNDTLMGMYRLFAILCALAGALVVAWAIAGI
jgi:hypothetical protein